MAKNEAIQVTIKYYADEILVTLPIDFNVFIKNICNMLSIPEEKKENFQFSYQNESDLKIYFIKSADDYNLLLKSCQEKKTKILNIQLSEDFNDEKDEIKHKDNKNEIKEISENKNNNKHIIEEEKEIKNDANINNINNIIQINNDIKIKNNSENIPINIDENLEAMEFSYLNAENNIIEENKKNNNNQNNIKNKQIKNNIKNNQLNNQNDPSELNKNFHINCSICKQDKFTDIVYYCSDCKLFFCDTCEIDIGKIHQHCYYKLRNKKQYNELIDSLNSFGNKIQNLNKNIINTGNTIENSVKGLFSEGSKFIGNIGNTIINFFNPNENDVNQNNNNDIGSNELNNPYEAKNEQNQENNKYNPDEINLKSLVMQAKSLYNLSKFNDTDIEKALIQHKGNIEEAVSMLLLDNNF